MRGSGRGRASGRIVFLSVRRPQARAYHIRFVSREGSIMPRGDKGKYTDKQKRQAEHIEESYEKRGVPEGEAERRAWATVNAMSGGGKKSGSGRGKTTNKAPAKKGGKKGGAASAHRSAAERSASAKKAAQTRARNKAAKSSSSR
jgi:hypothetical protein